MYSHPLCNFCQITIRIYDIIMSTEIHTFSNCLLSDYSGEVLTVRRMCVEK